MENKKIPFAVFVLKSMENKIKYYKEDDGDEFDALVNQTECEYCPLYNKQCDGYTGRGNCKARLREYVESAE